MAKIKLMFLVAFALVFAAGAGVGMVQSRTGSATVVKDPAPPSRHQSTPDLLGLSEVQRTQWTALWSKAMNHSHDSSTDHRAPQHERDAAIRELLQEDQLSAYDEIMRKYHEKMDESDRQRREAYDNTVVRSKALLTPEQLTKYEAILKERSSHGSGGPGSSSGSSRRGKGSTHNHEHGTPGGSGAEKEPENVEKSQPN